jgi:glycosyltransferase involved in cell wall biosynthesis
MEYFVSVIIPNFNGAATLGRCLEAVFSSRYPKFEVIVVDDCSTDNSVEIVKSFPCKLVRLDRRSGASKARNEGVAHSKGDILFFTDADCVLMEDTLAEAVRSFEGLDNAVIGGTYTEVPFDDRFFSTFQSIFVNYSETKKTAPDYIATHAMAIERALFIKSGGFPEHFLPILEDVEFSHRLRRSGCRLAMNPSIVVRHIFNFTLMKSLRNGFRKSMFWTRYSMGNRDLFADSGTASKELKVNVAFFLAAAFTFYLLLLSGKGILFPALILVFVLNLWSSRGLITAFYRTKGPLFALGATMYYTMLYPLAVGSGAFAGAAAYVLSAARK